METPSWRRSGQPCPKCGSTQTAETDWKNNSKTFKALFGQTGVVQRKNTYRMQCQDCGHTEDKVGNPSD